MLLRYEIPSGDIVLSICALKKPKLFVRYDGRSFAFAMGVAAGVG